MEFRTKVVVGRNNKKAYVAYAGLFIAASSLLFVFIPNMDRYIPWAFGIGIAVVVIGAVIAKGDVTDYGLSDQDLTVSMRGITIGDQDYPLHQISKLDFDVQAFEGMYVNDGAMVSGANSDGMTNKLSFEFGGKKIACGFYLKNAMHAQQLGGVFNAFYEGHIPFIEHNKSTQTYLFRVLTPSELVAFKRKYGYN